MRKPITMRFDPDLLAQAKRQAAQENRSLTNFIETIVRQRVTGAFPAMSALNNDTAEPSRTTHSVAGRNE